MEQSKLKPAHFLATPSKAGALGEEVAKTFAEIAESSGSAETKAAVAQLKIVKAKEVDVPATGKKALIIVIRYRDFKLHLKPQQQRMITECEKKLKRHVVFIAQRSVMKKNTVRPGLRLRPRSRTIQAVQDAMLEDIVAPSEVVGRRYRVNTDGSKVFTVYLDPRDRTKENLEEKLPTLSAVYQALTSKTTEIAFAEYTL